MTHYYYLPSHFWLQITQNDLGLILSRIVLNLRAKFRSKSGAITNFATGKEPKRNFLYSTDVTLVLVDIKSERFIKRTRLQQDLFVMTIVTIMFDKKSSESESFKCRGVYDVLLFINSFNTLY